MTFSNKVCTMHFHTKKVVDKTFLFAAFSTSAGWWNCDPFKLKSSTNQTSWSGPTELRGDSWNLMSQNYQFCFFVTKSLPNFFYSYLQWFFYKTSAWISSVSPASILTRSEWMAKWQDNKWHVQVHERGVETDFMLTFLKEVGFFFWELFFSVESRNMEVFWIMT